MTTTAISVRCPLGCKRTVAATGKEIHYCVIDGWREYVGTHDGEFVCCGATNGQVENLLNDYVLSLCEQGLIDTPLAALDADSDPFGDPRTDEEKQWDAEGWAECEGGREKFGPHPFDATRTVRHFRPRLFTAAVPADQDEDDFSDVPAGEGEPERAGRALPNGWMRMPEGDILDTDGMRVRLAEPTYHAPGHCRNCGGAHHVQRCGEVLAALRLA